MEKFGIFELLDALSAITQNDAPTAAEPQPAEDPPAPKKEDALGQAAINSFFSRHDKIAGGVNRKQ